MSYIRDLTVYLLPACAGLRTWQLYRPGAIAGHPNFSWRRYDIETIFVLLCIYYKKPTVTSGPPSERPSNVDLYASLLLAYKAVEQTSLCVVIVLHIPDPAPCMVMWVKVILLNTLSPVASHCYSSFSSDSRELFINTFEALGQQETKHWPIMIHQTLSSMKKNFNYLHHLVLFSRNK